MATERWRPTNYKSLGSMVAQGPQAIESEIQGSGHKGVLGVPIVEGAQADAVLAQAAQKAKQVKATELPKQTSEKNWARGDGAVLLSHKVRGTVTRVLGLSKSTGKRKLEFTSIDGDRYVVTADRLGRM